ncbi:hypothetical protein DFQ30_004760 [Apophysomyces sp. BC1015]|nr:hypothetical protein DFQ30_004760 [Apophysomyces sp. BC1015]
MAARRVEVASEIVDDLRDDPCPVDRIDRADLVLRLEGVVVRHRLDDVLAIVEHPFERHIEDVRILQAEHLRGLERAHFAVRRQHEHAHAALAAHRVFGSTAGVAGRRAKDIQLLAMRGKRVLEQVAEPLHRHVLERERRAVGQLQQRERRAALNAQRLERRDAPRVAAAPRVRVHVGAIRAPRQRAQVAGRNVIAELLEDLECKVRIRQRAPAQQLLVGHARIPRRQIQPAVLRQAAEQDV